MNAFFVSILNAIHSVVNNYGWTIVVFTVLIRLVLMPLDYKSRKGMRKMSALSAKQAELQRKYGNDKEKLNRKLGELYKKEGVTPLSGCVPMLIQWPILIIMFGAMREMTNTQTVNQVFQYLIHPDALPAMDSWLWIKNVWQPDSPFQSIVPSDRSLQMIDLNVWRTVFESLAPEAQNAITALVSGSGGTLDFSSKDTIAAIIRAVSLTDAYKSSMVTVSGWTNVQALFFSFSVYQKWNGLLILPALAAGTQILMNKLNPAQNGAPAAPAASDQQPAPNTGKIMMIIFPLMSVYFCLISNAGFAIYWVTSNIVMGIMTVAMNKYLEKKDARDPNWDKNKRVSSEGSVK